ncbi:hypothetical protein [Brucella pseudogrignonensis]|uniref:hypothetical protein n=1 Tax=Brucella pseudogrignonensis TaxID=419475 RepID=UPI003ECEEF59
MEWTGAQWLMIFYLGLKVIVQYGVPSGIFPDKLSGPEISHGRKFIFYRVYDAIFIAVLWWGGFF